MYMYMKLSLKDLNLDHYRSHSTNTYSCGATILPRVCNGICFLT